MSQDEYPSLTPAEERAMIAGERRILEQQAREAQHEHKLQRQGEKVPKAKQERLPGTGEASINRLEELALEYQECGERRKQLKLDLLNEMKENKKKHYEHNGLEITIVDGTEGIRVKMIREEDEGA